MNDLKNVLFTKMGWNLMKGDSTWCNIMRAKYLGNHNFSRCTWKNELPMGSKIWGNIMRNRTLMKEVVRWLLRNVNQINFWEDPWLIDEPLSKIKFGSLRYYLQD